MARESVFKKKERIRPPRVHITYEVETGDAIQIKELPFVAGVLADLSGNPKESVGKLKDRKFVEIDRDNFDEVLKQSKPRLAFRVDNRLEDDGSKLNVELDFSKLDDFNPENVAKQVAPLAELLEIRGKLKDLLSRMEGNDRLEEMLAQVVQNAEVQEKLKGALHVGDGGGSDAPEAAADADDAGEDS